MPVFVDVIMIFTSVVPTVIQLPIRVASAPAVAAIIPSVPPATAAAAVSAVAEAVVPIAYQQIQPVRVSLRSSSGPSDPGEDPRVSRIAVPGSR